MSHETELPQKAENLDLTFSDREGMHRLARIHEINCRYFGLIKEEKQAGECLIAVVEFYWQFSQVQYEAKVTRTHPLDLFDKAICNILERRGVMSKVELGEILALNVVEDPGCKKFMDPAEKELLQEALKSLQKFGMIEEMGLDFSYVRLTEKGKSFLSKKKKFYTQALRFQLAFDHTTGRCDHMEWLFNTPAKESIEPIEGENFKREEFIKEAVQMQRPDIFKPEELHDLKETEILDQQSYQVKIKAVLVADLCRGTVRALGFHPSSGNSDAYITRQLNTQVNLEKLTAAIPEGMVSPEITSLTEESWLQHVGYLMTSRQYLEALQKQPERELKIQAARFLTGQQIYDVEEFVNHFAEIIPASSKEYFFNITAECSALVASVVSFIQYRLTDSQKVYVLLPDSNLLTRKILKQVQKLTAFAASSYHVYVGISKDQKHNFLLKTDESLYCPAIRLIDLDLLRIPKLFMQRRVEHTDNFSLSCYFEQLSHSMILQSKEELITKCQLLEMNADPVAKVLIEEEEVKYQKIKSLEGICEDGKLKAHLHYYEKYLTSLKHSFALQIETDVYELTACLEETRLTILQLEELSNTLDKMEEDLLSVQQAEHELTFFVDFKSALQVKRRGWTKRFIESMEKKFLNDELNKFSLKELDKVLNSVARYLQKNIFSEEEKQLLNRLKCNIEAAREVVKITRTYLVDTNIFIKNPNIVDDILQFHRVILSSKVIDELHSFTQSERLKLRAQNALAVLMRVVNAGHPGLMMKDADVRVLPKDFKRTNADNLILSIGLKNKKMNPILLTEDHGLTLKAVSQKLETQTLADFKALQKEMRKKVKHQRESMKKT